MEKLTELKHVISLYAFLLVAWGFYRLLFILPVEVDELVLKPLLWLVPTFYLVRKEKRGLSSLGWGKKGFTRSFAAGLIFGLLFLVPAFLVGRLRGEGGVYQDSFVLFSSLGVALATAITEETTFRGFILNRLLKVTKREWFSNFLTSIGWAFIHLPIAVFVFRNSLAELAALLLLTTLFSLASGLVFARTKNIAGSIALHILWGWPIILLG